MRYRGWIVMCSVVLFFGCGLSNPVATHDTGYVDLGFSDADLTDVANDIDPGTADSSRTVDFGRKCERGTIPTRDGEDCFEQIGCARFSLLNPDHGCLLLPDTQGRFTEKECESDADCEDSPYGPYCFLRVCHSSPPCDDDSDCEAPEECYDRETCLPPSSECTTDEDCLAPGHCGFNHLCV